jgi:hypothetical protein
MSLNDANCEINPGLTGPSIWIVVAQLRIVYTGWQAG